MVAPKYCHIKIVTADNMDTKKTPNVAANASANFPLKLEKPRCRNSTVRMKNKNTKSQYQMFWQNTFHKIAKHLKQLEPSTFHSLPHVKIPLPQEGFPSPNPSSEATAVVGLRIHFRLGLDEPLDDRNVAVLGCQKQRCVASGSRGPRGQARRQNPTERTGRKTLRKFWRRKSGSFGNCGHSKSSLDLRNIATLWV